MAPAAHVSPVPSAASSLQYGSFMPPSKPHAVHKRHHRRGNSGGASFQSTPLAEEPFPVFKPARNTNRAPDELWSADLAPSSPATSVNASKKIKPYLRKFSPKEIHSTSVHAIDLSLPAAENPSLTGLGIESISGPDVPFAPPSRARHARSTSNNSQFSTNSGFQRPTVPYAHPMRQTPRPYTPPVAKSYSTSVIESDHSEEADDIMSPEEFSQRQHHFDPTRRSGSISSLPTAPPPLHIHTSSSMTRLASASQTSLPHYSTRSRGDTMTTMKSMEATSPSSRTSMDKAMSFIRGDREPVDAASRAASISAARQAFREKEEAKERKAEKDELRQLERQLRKTEKKENRQRRRSDADGKHKSRTTVSSEKTSASSVGGTEYGKIAPTQSSNLPVPVATVRPVSRHRRDEERRKLGAKSRWMGFMAWLRTRLLKIGRKMKMTK